MTGLELGTIDKQSPLPLYHQVASLLETAIRTGRYEVGELLEGEHHLADRFGVSRLTLRKAVDGLVSRGLLSRERGVGTRVLNPGVARRLVAPLTSLREDLERDGVAVTTQVRRYEDYPCPPELATIFGVEPGYRMRYLERLRSVEDEPIALMRNVLPSELLVTDVDELTRRSLYDILRDAASAPRTAEQTISAEIPAPELAEVLHIAPTQPVLSLVRIGYDAEGRCIEHSQTAYAAERYSFQMDLVEG